MDPIQIEKLKADHPGTDLHLLTAAGIEIVVRQPQRPQYVRYKALRNDEKKSPTAFETFVRDCCVFPDSAGLDAIFERKPVLVDVFCDRLLRMAGAAEEVEAKPL